METRSSPSLQVLQGLARQAHIDAGDVSALSKPALFGHLRSNYDYDRLERAHQVALKRGGDDGSSTSSVAGSNSSSADEPVAARRSKRHCRVGHQVAAAAGGGSSSAQPCEEQGLPPASIFVQTRSRSRMLAAAAGSAAGASSAALESTHLPRSLSSAARAGGARVRRGAATARGRTRPLKLSRGRGGGETSSSSSASDKRGGNGGGGSSGARSSGVADDDGATAEAEDAVDGQEGRRADGAEANEGAERRAKRRGRSGDGGRGASPGRRKGKGKGKGKAKAKKDKGSGDGSCKGERLCDGGGREGKVSGGGGDEVGGGKEEGGQQGEQQGGEEKEKRAEGGPNELDPIMLVKVGEHNYRFVRPNGRVVMYNLDSLVDYFISTGDFLEPETRLPFSDDELRDIDYKVKAAGLSKPSVLDAKQDPCRYTEQKFQQDALVGLERMISELVTGMLRVVEESDREEGEIRLVTEIFPPFADLFKQIWSADRAFASQCMQHYTSWLQGPPNRPTEDEMGFLDVILGFLKQLQECEGSSSLGF